MWFLELLSIQVRGCVDFSYNMFNGEGDIAWRLSCKNFEEKENLDCFFSVFDGHDLTNSLTRNAKFPRDTTELVTVGGVRAGVQKQVISESVFQTLRESLNFVERRNVMCTVYPNFQIVEQKLQDLAPPDRSVKAQDLCSKNGGSSKLSSLNDVYMSQELFSGYTSCDCSDTRKSEMIRGNYPRSCID